MMRDRLIQAAKDPSFKLILNLSLQNLITASRSLSAMGIDIREDVRSALQSISDQVTLAAYDVTNLDALLEESQAIGDQNIVQKKKTRPPARTETEENIDKSTGNIREPD